MQLTYAGLKVTAQAPTFPIASGQPWDATPNECLQPLSIAGGAPRLVTCCVDLGFIAQCRCPCLFRHCCRQAIAACYALAAAAVTGAAGCRCASAVLRLARLCRAVWQPCAAPAASSA